MRPQRRDSASAGQTAPPPGYPASIPTRLPREEGISQHERIWDLTLEASDVMRSRFLEEAEARYARTMQAAFRRDDLAQFETLRISRDEVLESVFSGLLEPWCVRRTDAISSPLRVRRSGDGTRLVRVVLRGSTATSLLCRFGATETELELLRGAIETTGGASGQEVQALLRDPRLGLLALPGANDPTRLKHAWASDASALLLVCRGDDPGHRPKVVGLSEGRNSLRLEG